MSKEDEMYSEEELKAIERLDRLTIGSIIQTTDIENASTIMYDKIILLNLITKQQKKIENIKKEVQEHIAFENRLKRDNTEPDLFNQGRFYVANNIKDILNGKEII